MIMKNTLSFDRKSGAADCGSKEVKLLLNRKSKPVSMVSCIQYRKLSEVLAGDKVILSCAFQCKRSTTKSLNGKYWVVDPTHVLLSGKRPDEVAIDESLKITNALPLFLSGCITNKLINPGETRIRLVMSHHNPDVAAKALRSSMAGAHEVIYQGQTYSIVIHMPEQGVLEEGFYVNAGGGQPHIVLDIGYLTNLITLKGSDGSRIRPVHRGAYGVNRLGKMIQSSSKFKKAPELMSVMQAIRDYQVETTTAEVNGQMKTKTTYKMPCNIEGIADLFPLYKEFYGEWLRYVMAEAIHYRDNSGYPNLKIYAIGGGVNLPLIKKNLEANGIGIYTIEDLDSLFTNVRSIYDSVLEKELANGYDKIEGFEPDKTFDSFFEAKPKKSAKSAPNSDAVKPELKDGKAA